VSEQRILVLAPNWLGDAVMSLPALADLRRHFNGALFTVAARSAVAPLYSLVPGVDEVVSLQWRGKLTGRRTLRADVERLRSTAARTAILFPNSFASAWLVRAAGIGERWGFARDLRRPLLTRPVPLPRGRMHQASYYQALARGLGVDNGPLEPRLEVPERDTQAARTLLASRGWAGTRPLLVVAPGAAYGTAKRWLPAHFARLIAATVRDRGMHCVLVGSAADAETTRAIIDAVDDRVRRDVIDLAGATSLEMLAAILAHGAVCVSNDSGAMHLAGAVGVPLAALFGPTREYETAPLTRPPGRAEVLTNPVWCRPCMLRECPIDHRCMKGLHPDRVVAAVDRMAGTTPP
jgi:heptosyltransferase II